MKKADEKQDIGIQGYLYRKTPGAFATFKKKYFILQNQNLFAYENESDYKVKLFRYFFYF
jgi:hypothetical protein